jgi:hypothetical protein
MTTGRELSLAGACLFGGAAVGGLLAAGAGGTAFTPAAWFWPLLYVLIALAVLFCTGYVVALRREVATKRAYEAFHASPAFDLTFDGEGTRCIHQYHAPASLIPIGTTFTAVPSLSGTPLGLPMGVFASGPPQPHMLVRLHVKNLRDRALTGVRVKVCDARRVEDGQPAHPYPYFLKWMHDDTDEHPFSLVKGRDLPPDDAYAYVDLATKCMTAAAGFVLEFPLPHLRNIELAAQPTSVALEVTGADKESNREAPPVRKRFIIGVRPDGGLSVTPGDAT